MPSLRTLGEVPSAALFAANLSSASLERSDSFIFRVVDSILRMQSGFVDLMKPSLKSFRNGNLDLMAAKSPSVMADTTGRQGSGQPCP
jgi:hypothetical protein